MGRKKKSDKQSNKEISIPEVVKAYEVEIDTKPEYSLEVDPTNKYNLPQSQKNFIKYYCQYKNIPAACDLANIDVELGKAYLTSYESQEEIKRINMAMYHRQFSLKLLTLQDIGGYLTSLLTDINVPIADRLKSKEKLEVVRLILDVNDRINNAVQNPDELMSKDLDIQLKNLSIDTLKMLLSNLKHKDDKKELVDGIKADKNLSSEELAYLKTLPTSDLLQLLETNDNNTENKEDK